MSSWQRMSRAFFSPSPRLPLLFFALLLLTATGSAQDPFIWTHSSIGGGGFCLEIRFAPPNFFNRPNNQTLYLATDVSGVYRSEAMAADGEVTQWQRLVDLNPPSDEKHSLHLYATTLAFTDKFQSITGNHRLIAGTQEGMFIWNDADQTWRAPGAQPNRDTLAALGMNMNTKDGKLPWISVIRQCPPNTRYLTAGLGDIREDNSADFGQFGLSAVLRSSDGGDHWKTVRIPQGVRVSDDEEVHDIGFIIHSNTLSQMIDYTFVSTDMGIYMMWDSIFATYEKVNFRRISPDTSVAKHWRGLAVLGQDAGAVQTVDDTLFVLASRRSLQQVPGVYRLRTSLASLLNPNYTPVWKPDSVSAGNWENLVGRLGTAPGSRIGKYQLFLGKNNYPALCVTNESNPPRWHKIYHSPASNNADNGYREDFTELNFGALDCNPADTLQNPNVYGCWRYGPIIAKGNSSEPYNDTRQIEQMFTTDKNEVPIGADGDKYYKPRGDGDLDEVDFKECPPVFHPADPSIIMVGCPDNGVLRSIDAGQSWSQRRVRSKNQWKLDYGTSRQGVFHVAFHPRNPNIVLASAGTVVTSPPYGELAVNTLGGKGTETNWSTIAGGPFGQQGQPFKGLPNSTIVGFVFDANKPGTLVDSNGVFVALFKYGLYYGKIKPEGTVDPAYAFKKITDNTLTDVIPTSGYQKWLAYSRIFFDPYDPDVLYVSRGAPAGGVFRIRLKSNRLQLNVTDCVEQVDEVIKGRYVGNSLTANDTTHAVDVNNVLITPTHVFAAVSPWADTLNHRYPGGLVRWTKPNPPSPEENNIWVIGGMEKIGGAYSTTIAIGGLGYDFDDSSIYAITYRFTLQEENKSDPDPTQHKRAGESNYEFMNLWRSTDAGATFTKIVSSTMKYPNAANMAFFSDAPNKLKLLVPTKGNGVWIGERTIMSKYVAMPDTSQADEGLPKRFALHPNFPNPFNPTTVIKYDLPKPVPVKIVIYDVLGRKVRTLIEAPQKAGYHAKNWDGKNDAGLLVTSGIYLCRLQASEFIRVRKMTLLR